MPVSVLLMQFGIIATLMMECRIRISVMDAKRFAIGLYALIVRNGIKNTKTVTMMKRIA